MVRQRRLARNRRDECLEDERRSIVRETCDVSKVIRDQSWYNTGSAIETSEPYLGRQESNGSLAYQINSSKIPS